MIDKASRILDKLDARGERQQFLPGADAPHVVSILGGFNTAAGLLERHLAQGLRSVASAAGTLRMLRRMLATHALLCRIEAQRRQIARAP